MLPSSSISSADEDRLSFVLSVFFFLLLLLTSPPSLAFEVFFLTAALPGEDGGCKLLTVFVLSMLSIASWDLDLTFLGVDFTVPLARPRGDGRGDCDSSDSLLPWSKLPSIYSFRSLTESTSMELSSAKAFRTLFAAVMEARRRCSVLRLKDCR